MNAVTLFTKDFEDLSGDLQAFAGPSESGSDGSDFTSDVASSQVSDLLARLRMIGSAGDAPVDASGPDWFAGLIGAFDFADALRAQPVAVA